jgi:hypothetical protein
VAGALETLVVDLARPSPGVVLPGAGTQPRAPSVGEGYSLGTLRHAHCPVFLTLAGAAGPGGVTVVPRCASCTTWGKYIKVDASRRRAAAARDGDGDGEGALGGAGARCLRAQPGRRHDGLGVRRQGGHTRGLQTAVQEVLEFSAPIVGFLSMTRGG